MGGKQFTAWQKQRRNGILDTLKNGKEIEKDKRTAKFESMRLIRIRKDKIPDFVDALELRDLEQELGLQFHQCDDCTPLRVKSVGSGSTASKLWNGMILKKINGKDIQLCGGKVKVDVPAASECIE